MDGAHHCTDACATCERKLLSVLQRQAADAAREIPGLDVDIYALPCAADLVCRAKDIALSTRVPVSAGLRMLVDDIDRQLSIGRDTLARAARIAALQIAETELI
jgi:hypothetical protein